MAITHISIHHFRNISQTELLLSNRFNFFIGKNGSGKTSLLEALYMLGHGRAFRNQPVNRIIQHHRSELVIHGRIEVNNSEHCIGIAKSRYDKNKVKINGDYRVKTADLAQLLPIQLITPECFNLITGSSKYRRSFLDWGCFHHFPDFFVLWNKLRRLIKQRNTLLRQISNYEQLRYWDKNIAKIAKVINQFRKQYAAFIINELNQIAKLFLPEYSIEYHYYPGWDEQKDYIDLLAACFIRDKQLTYTSLGPHRADLRFKIGQLPATDLLSRGQLKLLVCALRLAQGEFYTKQTNKTCLYLIDDFASELDNDKRALLADRLKKTEAQVFITAIDNKQITSMIDKNDKLFHVKCGTIYPC